MEKLIELLNEYMQPYIKYKWWNVPWRYFLNYDEWADLHEEEVISKKFWFIKRLVDNDKIDKACLFFNTADLPDDDVSKLLMILSTADNPIEDLISYLKEDE